MQAPWDWRKKHPVKRCLKPKLKFTAQECFQPRNGLPQLSSTHITQCHPATTVSVPSRTHAESSGVLSLLQRCPEAGPSCPRPDPHSHYKQESNYITGDTWHIPQPVLAEAKNVQVTRVQRHPSSHLVFFLIWIVQNQSEEEPLEMEVAQLMAWSAQKPVCFPKAPVLISNPKPLESVFTIAEILGSEWGLDVHFHLFFVEDASALSRGKRRVRVEEEKMAKRSQWPQSFQTWFQADVGLPCSFKIWAEPIPIMQ